MKKKITLLIACISLICLSLMTGCTEAKVELKDEPYAQAYIDRTDELFQEVFVADEAEIDKQVSICTETGDDLFLSLYQGWANEHEKLGDYVGIKEVSVYESEDSGVYAKSYACEITYEFSERNAVAKIVYTAEGEYDSISIEGVYTFGEKMEKAALNTVLGMGTVFVVLILITFVISGFGVIGKLTQKKSSKKNAAADVVPAASSKAEEAEVITDDYELVAVITAAIAAMEAESGSSADGLVVRSIRRVNKTNSKWRNA